LVIISSFANASSQVFNPTPFWPFYPQPCELPSSILTLKSSLLSIFGLQVSAFIVSPDSPLPSSTLSNTSLQTYVTVPETSSSPLSQNQSSPLPTTPSSIFKNLPFSYSKTPKTPKTHYSSTTSYSLFGIKFSSPTNKLTNSPVYPTKRSVATQCELSPSALPKSPIHKTTQFTEPHGDFFLKGTPIFCPIPSPSQINPLFLRVLQSNILFFYNHPLDFSPPIPVRFDHTTATVYDQFNNVFHQCHFPIRTHYFNKFSSCYNTCAIWKPTSQLSLETWLRFNQNISIAKSNYVFALKQKSSYCTKPSVIYLPKFPYPPSTLSTHACYPNKRLLFCKDVTCNAYISLSCKTFFEKKLAEVPFLTNLLFKK